MSQDDAYYHIHQNDPIVQFFSLFKQLLSPPAPLLHVEQLCCNFLDPETAASRHFLLTKIFRNNTKFATFFLKGFDPVAPLPWTILTKLLHKVLTLPCTFASRSKLTCGSFLLLPLLIVLHLATYATIYLIYIYIYTCHIPAILPHTWYIKYQTGTPPTSCLPNAPTSLSSTTWWSSTGSARASSSSCRSQWSRASRTCVRGWSRRSAAPCFVPCKSSAEGVLGQRWSLQTKKRQNKCADEKNSHMYWHLWRKQ